MSFKPELLTNPPIIRNIYSRNQLLNYIDEGQGTAPGLFCFIESTDSHNIDDGRLPGSYRHKLDLTAEGPPPIVFTPVTEGLEEFEIELKHIIGGQVKVISDVDIE